MELLYFILSTYGICGLIAILNHRYCKWKWLKISECPFCLGFWVGLVLFLSNGHTDLFNFNITILNAILMAFISGASTYILGMIVDDNGIRINQNK